MSETYIVTGTGANAKYTISKSPGDILDYPFNWGTNWLAEIVDTIASHTITPEAGITCNSSSVVGDTVVAWISGGTEGTTYRVTCQIVTTGGRTFQQSIFIKIKER